MPPTPKPEQPAHREPWQPVAGLLAFLIPGAGHFHLGHRRRGVFIGTGVALLFVTGLLFGGIDSVDRRENPLWFWFYGQMWNGPAVFVVDWIHQKQFKVVDPIGGFLRSARPDEYRDPRTGRPVPIRIDPATNERFAELPDASGPGVARVAGAEVRPPKLRTLGRVSELGTLFIAVAGMMNLIAIIDAMFKPRAD